MNSWAIDTQSPSDNPRMQQQAYGNQAPAPGPISGPAQPTRPMVQSPDQYPTFESRYGGQQTANEPSVEMAKTNDPNQPMLPKKPADVWAGIQSQEHAATDNPQISEAKQPVAQQTNTWAFQGK
jgi:hypothetical protein